MKKGVLLLLILLTQPSAAPADRTNKLRENLLCRARTGWRGWSQTPGRMKLMTVCSMSKGALARLTGPLLQQKSWLLPLEMCSKCSCCPAAEMGKGWGRTLTSVLWLPIQPTQSLHSQCQSGVGPAESQAGSSRLGRRAGANSSARLPPSPY